MQAMNDNIQKTADNSAENKYDCVVKIQRNDQIPMTNDQSNPKFLNDQLFSFGH